MNSLKLVIKSLLHFWKRNLLLSLGFAISTAVLTGALIVGDSVKYSLNKIVEQRLGSVKMLMLSGDRFFTEDLTENLRQDLGSGVSGVLKVEGIAVADGGRKHINNVHVLGVDSSFDKIADLENFYGSLAEDQVIISTNLAERLSLGEGDEFLLRMTKASMVPLNAPFVSDADNQVSLRVTIAGIASLQQLGAFNLKTSQTAPFNIFISSHRLRELMKLGNRSNLLLLAGNVLNTGELADRVKEFWTPEDAGLEFQYMDDVSLLDVKSSRVFLDDVVAAGLFHVKEEGQAYITYFVNRISTHGKTTPYSFISSLPDRQLKGNEIIINQWLANDLGAKPGDHIDISYFVVGPLRVLDTANASFTVKSIIPMSDIEQYKSLMPDIPGMSDAGNCRDWETGVPISLEEIRDKDEAYWKKYKGTPKAYIALSRAEELWKNRFGIYTSFRFNISASDLVNLEKEVMSDLDPKALGFEFKNLEQQARYSAENGVDFSELFGGLSFFLLAGAIILSILLFRLNLEDRKKEIMTLSALGIPNRKIRNIIMNESIIVARVGALLGIGIAIFYNRLIFKALNSIWKDIVRTNMLEVDIKIITLLIGLVCSMVLAWIILFFVINGYLKKISGKHKKPKELPEFLKSAFTIRLAGIIIGVIAIGLICAQFVRNEVVNPELFFSAGGLLLLSGLLFSYDLLLRLKIKPQTNINLRKLSLKNAVSNMPRSMSIIILLAMGTFIVISTGSNRKDLFVNAMDKSSGTGGFLYYAESTIPLLNKLSEPEQRKKFGLSNSYSIVQMRVAEGDDASCLNLNRITNPQTLSVDPENLKGRFSFTSILPEYDRYGSWDLLTDKLDGELIPAIADETVIKWGLALELGDTLIYQDALGKKLKLLLVGALAPSIFQGNVLISEKNFLKHFPASSGTKAFLIEGSLNDTALINEELRMSMRDFGWSMEFAAKRLAKFNSITNTYLSIFMILGAIGLLLATIGLSLVLFRSILERKGELALLRAVGYSIKSIRRLLLREYFSLFFIGTLIGALSSILATLPSFLSENTGASLTFVLLLIFILLLNGVIWIICISFIAFKNKSLSVALRND